MGEVWSASVQELQGLRDVHIPSNAEELRQMAMLVVNTFLKILVLLKKRVNEEFYDTEPVFLILGTAFFFISASWIRKLVTYDDFIPSNKRTGLLERIRKLPILRTVIDRKMEPILRDLQKNLKKDFATSLFKISLPSKGHDVKTIIDEVESYLHLSKIDWKSGSVSGAIYSPNDSVYEQMLLQVYGMTMKSNHLHADVFSGIRKMEAELIRWISSGGTESIVLACKSFRDFALKTRGITRPEILVPVTAHAAFDKAADWLCLEIRKVPLDPKTLKVDVRRMRKMINSNTIMLVGSTPGYPHGIVDPIEEITALGECYGIPVHVDCCLGGFIMPFMDAAGFPMRPFDFRLKGVTSISADTHKYAMAPKGTSVIMYSNKKYLHCQFSVAQDWPGGVYITPTISGSRSGAVVACCWASLRYHGVDGYVKACKEIVAEARRIRDGIREIKELRLLGEPEVSVVAFTSDTINIFEVNSRLTARHWHLNPLQFPSGVHFCVTAVHTQNNVASRFLKDLREVVDELIKDPNQKVSSEAAVYGLAQTIPDRSIIKELLFSYMDVIYSTEDLKEQ
ncbi:sphingosine-1-phosphate lyase-like [Tropilaelaps mercedesae]|uniref:sphinganine-1-phosphate aldolase n=1 Tax=Tropilaelaps mercedesae TaxID=418985 RepID=A0A1V9XZI7_9ACAR|nr:sphingosine-1-phosphate lyase-like [Tropilaelaps mercedesae]